MPGTRNRWDDNDSDDEMNQKDKRRRKPEEFVFENVRKIGFFGGEQGVRECGDRIWKMFMLSPLSMEHRRECDHRQPDGQNQWNPEEKRPRPCVPWNIEDGEFLIDAAQPLDEANE